MANGRRDDEMGTRIVIAVAVFLVLCGLILVVVGGGDGAGSVEPEKTADHAWSALKNTDEAERAINSADYGRAQRHVQTAKDELTEVVKALKEE